MQLHPQVVGPARTRSSAIMIETQESGVRIIDKTGPLANPADRDHCLQYMVAVPLIFGRLTADDYEDEVARDPRIDALRAKMIVRENATFSREYLDPDKRSIGNAVQVFFKDGSQDRARRGRVSDRAPPAARGRHSEARREVPREPRDALRRAAARTYRGRVRGSSRARVAAGCGFHGALGEAREPGAEISRGRREACAAADSGRDQRVLRAARRASRLRGRVSLGRGRRERLVRPARSRHHGARGRGRGCPAHHGASRSCRCSSTSIPVGAAHSTSRAPSREMERAGAAALHIEDQEQAKRCGHRPNKATVSTEEMCDRLKAAVDARRDEQFVDHGAHRRVRARRHSRPRSTASPRTSRRART